jgi:CRISPR type III-B/RAMP module-associated protein Cmr5
MGEKEAISPQGRALRDFELIYKLYLDGNIVYFGKSFRSRARETPSFLYEVGLISGLSFIYAKTDDATKRTYAILLNCLKGDTKDLKKLDSKEGGYAAYLHLLLLEISRLVPDKNLDLRDPLSCIKALEGLDRPLVPLLIPYLLEIKRLAEATLPSEG